MKSAKQVIVHEFGGPEVLKVVDVDVPAPGPGQVLIRVEAAGVLYGDIMRRTDRYVAPTPLPYAPGTEIAGMVLELGPGVTYPKVGSRIIAFVASSGYAQYAITDADRLISLPEEIGYAEATALLAQGVTAYLLTHDVASLKDKSVFIESASGGVGMQMVQFAQAEGAKFIVGAASTEEKRTFAREAGVHLMVDSKATGWAQEVLAATEGRGVDVAYESSGASFDELLKCLSPFGTLVKFGRGVNERLTFDPSNLVNGNQSMRGFYLPGYRDAAHFHLLAEATAALISQVLAGKLYIRIAHRFALHQAVLAHHAIENRSTIGKVVIEPWRDAA